jgi:16S rRNA (cytidine1402-2'-O)-methyltransferase
VRKPAADASSYGMGVDGRLESTESTELAKLKQRRIKSVRQAKPCAVRPPQRGRLDRRNPMPTRAQHEPGSGSLYLVATPIGNLEDITVRALRILQEVDLIACEDTRQTSKLLHHYGIRKELLSYHEHNELTRAPELVIEIEQGAQVALVSDAGMPVISDPGHHLVGLCLRHRIPVIPIPGPSAFVAALAVSGLPSEEFLFVGFLPARTGSRRKALKILKPESRTLILYEAPHRIVDTVSDALELLGPRPAVIAREVTKLHEEFLRGTLADLLESARKRALRGEITLLIGPPTAEAPPVASPVSLKERVEQLEAAAGLDHKAALKQAARERGLGKREAYRQLLLDR